MTLLSQELKLCHLAVLMNRNRKEHQEKKMVEAIEEEVEDMMIKMETTEEEVAEEATKVVVVAVAVDAAMEIEVIEIEETEVIEEIKVEETMTEMEEEEVVNGMEETVTLEEEEATVVEVGMAAAMEEVQVGTKAQATTTLTRKLIIEIPTTMILLMAVALLTQVINFQLLQPHLTLKIFVLKGITTLNPKINTNNLLDHHRLTLLFI